MCKCTKAISYVIATMLICQTILAVPTVRFQTVLGEFFVKLTPTASPNTVANFLNYVRNNSYDQSFFHRAQPGFVVQGGGFAWPDGAASYSEIPADPAVVNEFNVTNARGTVAMAKIDGDPNSATNQWFVNVANNGLNLDNQNGGFTVFGTVDAGGMRVVDSIATLQIISLGGGVLTELPVRNWTGGSVVRDNVALVLDATEFQTIDPVSAAILPSSRSIQIGTTATAFATLLNPSPDIAASCKIGPATSVPATFSYQQTDPATNVPIGELNPLVDIPANGSASFVFSLTPTGATNARTMEFAFQCGNAFPSSVVMGVNTFDFSVSTDPISDVVALAATQGGLGIVDIPGEQASGAFSVATVNVGAAETVEVTADTGAAVLPVALFVCETEPLTGACLAPPSASVSRAMSSNSTATFAVFAQGSASVPFDPANNRAFVRFRTAAGELRGSTSVAVRTVGQ